MEQNIVDAVDGKTVVSTIDVNIQGIIEKHLSDAVNEYECDSGITIAMDPSTGKILGMADYPNFDPNNHNIPNSTLAQTWDSLSSEEKSISLLKCGLQKL